MTVFVFLDLYGRRAIYLKTAHQIALQNCGRCRLEALHAEPLDS